MISRGIEKSAARSVARSLSQFGSGGGAPSYDTDAQTYITAVEAADGQSLETGVKDAINAFVVGCKSDGIWTAIKASCILAGARTLTGALVPLVGTAPTNNNFVSGDYSRTAGLTGDGSTKYLDSNRNNNVDPLDSKHLSAYVSSAGASVSYFYIGGRPSDNSNAGASILGSAIFVNSDVLTTGGAQSIGFRGVARSNSTSINYRRDATNTTPTVASTTACDRNLAVFALMQGVSFAGFPADATLSFYSIGEALDLADLDTRVTTLITDIGTALA